MVLQRILKAEDLFSRLTPENEEINDRKIKIKTDKGLEEITKDFERILEKAKLRGLILQSFYLEPKNMRKYSSKEIERFSLVFRRYNDLKHFNPAVGIFLSYLIKNSYDKSFVVHTSHLEKTIQCLGYSNSKEIIIKGNSGSNLGRDMKSGKIIVEGYTEENIGHNMTGGFIEIKGNANSQIGYFMGGGEIVLRGDSGHYLGGFMENGMIISFGNTKKYVGLRMKGGTIHLNGDYKSISKQISGGNIYHKGTQIIKNGKAVPRAEIKWQK
jgi:formylmethanofuran dehydrogenase subunit C